MCFVSHSRAKCFGTEKKNGFFRSHFASKFIFLIWNFVVVHSVINFDYLMERMKREDFRQRSFSVWTKGIFVMVRCFNGTKDFTRNLHIYEKRNRYKRCKYSVRQIEQVNIIFLLFEWVLVVFVFRTYDFFVVAIWSVNPQFLFSVAQKCYI